MREIMDRIRARLGRPVGTTALADDVDADEVDCTVVSRVMHAYLDGELRDEDLPLVTAHVDDCDRCGLAAELHRAVIRRLNAARQTPDPAAITRLQDFASKLAEDEGTATA